MCSDQYRKVKRTFSDFENSWEEEIQCLKFYLKKAEKKALRSDQCKLTEKAKIQKESKGSDRNSLNSSKQIELWSSPATASSMLPAGAFAHGNAIDSAHKDLISVQREKLKEYDAKWVSPSVLRARQLRKEIFHEAFSSCPDSSFDIDCGSSIISLDFGLVSPHRNWCSPPQRIERAQNREWSSPHRVIDRPNPENSPGNWISIKESCLPLTHSPTLGTKYQPVEAPIFSCPEPGLRPSSQATYVVPEAAKVLESEQKISQPSRKMCVLMDYEPERVVLAKNRTGGSGDHQSSNEKIRRVDDSSGHVVKVSLLEDFEAPVFGKIHEKCTEVAEKENTDKAEKSTRTNKKTKISCKLSLSASKPQAKKMKKEEPKEEGGTSVRIQSAVEAVNNTKKNTEEKDTKKEENANEDKIEGVSKSTQKIIEDLEEILRPSNREKDVIISPTSKEKTKGHKPKLKKIKPCPKAVEEKPVEPPEKRKRNVDPKAVQEYIKSQKQKRIERVKTEKKTKDAEKEARKKKLEELRITTLKLATQSKKKKLFQPTIKVVEPGTEDEITMSLGLKQIRPKVSYNESISKLKKRTLQQKLQSAPMESEPADLPEEKSGEKEDGEKTPKNLESVLQEEKSEEEKPDFVLKKPDDAVEMKTSNDLNATLKKLAETLHLKLEKKEKQYRSRPVSLASKSVRDPLSRVPSQETLGSAKSASGENRQLVTVDLETIQTLKSDIKKISENFKILHEIILDKPELSGKATARQQQLVSERPISCHKDPKDLHEWLKSVVPKPYPYNVFTAFQKKMNIKLSRTPSSVSQESSTFAEPISNKYDSEFEALSIPSDRLCSTKEIVGGKGTSRGTSEANYYSMKEDSGSELSSSILDSEKQSWGSVEVKNLPFPRPKSSITESKNSPSSPSSSIATEISCSIHLATSRALDTSHSNQSKSSFKRISSDRENLVLITPDLKLISNDLHQDKFSNYTKNLNVEQDTCKIVELEELNNSDKSYKEQKSDSTITEIIDNLTENERSVKSVKSINEKAQNVVRRVDEVPHSSALVRRTFFQPEMLHLQFQAELTLLETFQQSLSHFLEAERMKTLSEVNKIVYEKAINTEKSLGKEDQAVQTSYIKESSDRTTSEETDSVKTEIAIEESPRAEKLESKKTDLISEMSEKTSNYSESGKKEKETQQKEAETPDFSNTHVGISFQMLNRMMKDEELRSEHQLALIRLREKTSNEKVKAELTFLEMKKRALKERGGDVEQSISAIKKKQRGILLKYQSEKEEIERLKKMHRIASEERKIMIKQQKQIQQMQMSTKDMIIKLKKRERSPTKKSPLKPKALLSSDSQSDIPEDIPVVSDSVMSESVCSAEESARHSTCTDLDFSSRSNISEDEDGIMRRNKKTLQSKISYSLENFKSKKSLLEVEKYPRKRHSVEELLSWTRRLEEKESHLKELEKQAMSAANRAKRLKSLKSVKTSMKDRSTSPFQFQDSAKTISEISPSASEIQKTSAITEVVESNLKTEVSNTEPVNERIQSNVSEDIPEQFSKKMSTSRTTEYCSESFESPSSSETPKTKPEVTRLKSVDGSHRAIAIKPSLSPRLQSPRRRYSSGSDDSVNLSHTETASEQSDLESRIAALHEQLRKRKLEAERLRREQKKAQRERLKVKEQSLLKQIQAYDAYIQKKKEELEQEYEQCTQTVMKPLIKQPKVAEKSYLKRQELQITSGIEKPASYAKSEMKNREEISEKIESDSEVLEQIKDISESIKEVLEESESIKEQVESKTEEICEGEEEKSAVVGSILDSEDSTKDNYSVLKSVSVSESLVEQDPSPSESEDQSISVKTTLLSPERETEKIDTSPTETCEEKSQNKQSFDENVYQFDSFESDVDEKVVAESEKTRHSSETSEVGTEIPSEVAEVTEEEKEEPEVLQDEEQNPPIQAENCDDSVSRRLEEAEAENQRKTEKAVAITDSIIAGMIMESLNVFCNKKAEAKRKLAEQSKLSLETLSSYLAKEIISEAVDDMLQIYNRKMAVEEDAVSAGRITSEIRKRVCEIMSQAGGATREQGRPQDMMITTYDISPVTSPPGGTALDGGEREKFLQTLSPPKRDGELEEESYPEGEEESHQELKAETYGQQWIDDDFGLSRTRREAEELRLQQLQIEQEIQQLQAQQEQVPYFYLREIPNKPPPPYTPPGKPLAEIPTSESDISAITINAVKILTQEMAKGTQIADIEPTWGYYEDAASEHLKCYKFFLFELAKYIISELINQQESKEETLPWMRTRERLSKYKYRKVERTMECLSDFVQKEVSILFGFGKKVSKESMIVKWIKKKRDHVDEILVGESQEEEAQWTQYDEDQVTVKNEVTLAILDGLLEDTAQVINSAFQNKLKRNSRNEMGTKGSG